ncbi:MULTISPECIES: hypothetical protein [unclassified Paenibacillus]|uniref:hypothetical protein n=1 Tax=unclassified Paenibacillus TaxID=185978 RepID=UPI00020D7401|nr:MULTISPECIES: hypothetical protein [unclassified Paenibacillus]EGL17486.1 hypothetical protein HMPREF9413_5403 [Paenibacillus sp. HGF7]EPD81269.1 hypothetical protein HMPREF1207_05026 [Paenibacillus sp. HGH0039]
MAVKKEQLVKVVNNMPVGGLGIDNQEGKIKILRKPGTSINVSHDDIWHIFNSCKMIQKGHLYIDDKSMRQELGLEDGDTVDVNSLSREELKEVVTAGNIEELKKLFGADLSQGTKEKIVILAREQYKESSIDAKILKLIETETGMPVAQENGEAVSDVNDVKSTKVPLKTK